MKKKACIILFSLSVLMTTSMFAEIVTHANYAKIIQCCVFNPLGS